jgi:hypothetical protein
MDLPGGSLRSESEYVYWEKKNLYYYIRNYSTQFSASECETVIQNAFNTWASVSQFTFTKTSNANLADIEISWEVDSNHGSCNDFGVNTLAHASIGIEQYTCPGYVHFNDIKPFSTDSTQYDLESTALHEIGHVLGLEHSSDITSVMYPYGDSGPSGVMRDVTSYDIITLNSIYGFPYFIDGPKLISTYGQYRIDDLPSGFDVTWSVSNSYYNNNTHLIPNSPAIGWCLLFLNEDEDMMDGTLTAEINYNNEPVDTLTKTGLYAYEGFKGHYTSGNLSGDISYTMIVHVKSNTNTVITSINLYGATVSYSTTATIPTYWNFSPTSGQLVVNVPYNGTIPAVININDGCGNQYTLYLYAQSSKGINVSYGDGCIIVAVNEDDDSDSGMDYNQPWTVEVRNAMTGALMTTHIATSRSSTISTTGWPKGIYIVKVTVDKDVLTEKVIVK